MQKELILGLPACAVATSGDYRRGLRIGGRWFSHIIDPRTGTPVPNVSSATVVAGEAATADALATAISVLGAQDGVALVDSLPGTECLIMSRREDGSLQRHLSAGFDSFISD
jgi:thiamine biosynthesis lipoprotein